MRQLVLITMCAAGLAACSRGTGTTDTTAMQTPVTVRGCLSQSGDTALLTVSGAGQRPGAAVGTTGSQGQRYRIIDEGHTGINRWLNREVEVTGKLEQPRQEGAAPGATDQSAESLTKLPAIRVAQMTVGGECTVR